jgi:hypothetical protein
MRRDWVSLLFQKNPPNAGYLRLLRRSHQSTLCPTLYRGIGTIGGVGGQGSPMVPMLHAIISFNQ